MNCQEGMDYMQRQLDGDLDERETDLLLDHTRQCPDCAEMFERLKRLSSELENLPRIAPSYSIVDSIMPRLEQLEQQRQLGEKDQADDRQYRRTGRSRSNSKQKRTSSFPYRLLGGVIAAGIVAGLFIVTYKPLGLQTANDSAATNSAVMLESKSSEPAANRSGAESSEQLPAAKKDAAQLYSIDQNGSAESAPVAADTPKENMRFGSEKTDLQETPSSPSEAEKRQAEQGNAESADTFGTEADSGSAQIQEDSAEAKFKSEEAAPAEDRFAVGLTAAGPEPFVSPDGAFQAVVQDETLEIYNTADNSLVFKSRKSGSIDNVNWSQDSAKLSYDVFSGEDSIERYIIDVKNKSETKHQAEDN